ncbi:hypothetical protein WNY79_20175 [Pseudoalteromonas sp. AS84]|uniref:hypothetical protein n=1 Tax=Pseudoalteromonas sp. AS84 TaxID=3135778 RepID=UPI00316AF2BA
MKLASSIIVIIIVLLLIWSDSNMWEDGTYAVYYIDGDIKLGIKIDDKGSFHGRVDSKIIAVGANESYVVAKQLIAGSDSVSYFYIDKKKDNIYLNPDEITEGPFTELQFKNLSQKLNFPNFSKEF